MSHKTSPTKNESLRQFLEIFRFELAFRRRHPPLYIFSGMCFLLAFLCMAIRNGMNMFGGVGTIAINAPVTIQRMMLTLCILFGLVITTAFVAGSVIRDDETKCQSLFFSTPLRKIPYLFGRFAGSMFAALVMISSLALGALLASVMPWQDPERLVPISLIPYLYSLFTIVFPNLFFVGTLAFSVAILTGRLMYSYVAILGLIVLYVVSGRFISDLDNDFIAAISDPFASRAYSLAIRYFTPAEMNTVEAPFSTELFINRLLWMILGLLVLAFSMARYRMKLQQDIRSNRSKKKDLGKLGTDTQSINNLDRRNPVLPTVHLEFDLSAQIAQLWFQTRAEIRGLVRSTPFLIIALFGVGNIVGGAFGIIKSSGTTTLPVTHLMVYLIQGAMSLFMLIVLIFYAGELVHRERKYKINELYDALPVPNWIPLISKLFAMLVGMVVLLVVAAATTVTFQLAKGYPQLELGLYLRDFAALQFQPWIIFSVAAIVIQVLTNHKFLGYLAMVLLFVLQAALPALDFEHNLYNFAALPQVNYSDMNGYGHFILPRALFTGYWLAFSAFLIVVGELFWVRGTDHRWLFRRQAAKQRFKTSRRWMVIASVLLWIILGSIIFYSTTVENRYIPSDKLEELAVQYEKKYKQYENLAQPRITSVSIDAELYPHERRVIVRGDMHLVNKNDEPIQQIHIISFDTEVEIAALEIPGAKLVEEEADLGYRIYELDEPMAPGAKMEIHFDYRKHLRWFANESKDNSIVYNGTFFNSQSYTPHLGYSANGELNDPNKRRDYGLPKRPRMAKIDNEEARKNTYLANDSDWIDFSAEISTAADQIAIAPGYLVKEWAKDGRRHFRYEMDSKILNFWSILSADYQVTRDEWRSSPQADPVAIEVYHHYRHHYNVNTMIESIKDSLEYFTKNFSPYQHRQVRVIEFPKYAKFAQSFPNTIPYSEGIGFIADGRDKEAIDYAYYVTSHEVAHQWWAHQVIGANVQGCTMMSESLAQYSALMVMQKHHGPEKMDKFLKYELDRYLGSRSSEQIEELPLLLVENQPYIHYRKGSLVFYALQQYIGEDALNEALRNYIAEVAFQEPPFTISTDLYKHLQLATPERYKYLLEDMFEKITLYDNRVLKAELSEREDGKFEVTLDLQIKKIYADGKGEETEAEGLGEWIEVGVYAKQPDESGKKQDFPLYLKQHYFESNETTLNIVVDEKPDSAGIDPRHLFIDREPDDNRKTLNETN